MLESLHNPLLEKWRIFFREQHLGKDCGTGLGVRQRRFCDEVQRIIVVARRLSKLTSASRVCSRSLNLVTWLIRNRLVNFTSTPSFQASLHYSVSMEEC
jgi:hypothetical protein